MRAPIDGGTVLITGASSGIGRELARQLALRAGSLVLVARRADRLKTVREEALAANPRLNVYPEPCDLADLGAVEGMLRSVQEKAGAVDILVNNAGLGHYNLYDRSDWDRIHRMLQVNVVGLALLTHRLVPGMVARGRGGIMNIGSGAGFALLPGSAAYVGTKYFVHGFSETLRVELLECGVVVTHVAPGPVETEFNEAAGVTGEPSSGSWSLLRISAEQCAREAIRGFERGQALVFPGRAYRLLMRLLGITPRPLQRLSVRAMARQLRGTGRG
jgi:uncharacterized protein